MRRSVAVLLAAVALAGCTTTGSSSSSKKFKGAQGDVATVVSDLKSAAQRKSVDKICSQILATTLVDRLDQAGTSCGQEVDKAITDADEYGLDVQAVTVTGTQATAKVRQGKDGRVKTLSFVREASRWKLSGIAAG
jgi:hypothetical protein